MTKVKEQKAITLIALVITIIVMLILASVAITLMLNNNGIFIKAKEAKEETNKQEATDIINLKITTAQMNKYAEKQEMPTLKELSEVLKKDNEVEYVTEKSQIASAKYEVGENPSSIYTKLYNYPYEFEINTSLQLASIDGKSTLSNNQISNASIIADELLIDGNHIVVPITTKWEIRNIDFNIKSIKPYNYLLFTYGDYDETKKIIKNMSTCLLPIECLNYGTSQIIVLTNANGSGDYASANIQVLDDSTIRFYQTKASSNTKTHFAITSIKGIK